MEPWVAPGDGADYITALPFELRARIASYLPFQQVPQLEILSRPWRHIHRHAPVVNLDLDDFNFENDRIEHLEIALARRGQDSSASKVDTLRITSSLGGSFARRHAVLIIALANAREIHLTPSRMRYNKVESIITGPGAAALQTLRLTRGMALREWPRLPSLRSLTIDNATIEPFQPGAYFPRLEELCIFKTYLELEHNDIHIDICLPLLKRLTLFKFDTDIDEAAGHFTIDAPELEELNVGGTVGWRPTYLTFTLRAPRLRCLMWNEVCVESMRIHVGRSGSVTSGRISLTWSDNDYDCPEMKVLRAQMMQMLEGLLPELPPECVADAARPYISFDKYTMKDGDYEDLEEKLTCDLSSLMSSLKA